MRHLRWFPELRAKISAYTCTYLSMSSSSAFSSLTRSVRKIKLNPMMDLLSEQRSPGSIIGRLRYFGMILIQLGPVEGSSTSISLGQANAGGMIYPSKSSFLAFLATYSSQPTIFCRQVVRRAKGNHPPSPG